MLGQNQAKCSHSVEFLSNYNPCFIWFYKVISFPDIQQNFHSSSLAIISILMLAENLYIL